MKVLILILVLTSTVLVNTSCGTNYWPQTLEPDYYEEGAQEVKEDIDDVAGSRTL